MTVRVIPIVSAIDWFLRQDRMVTQSTNLLTQEMIGIACLIKHRMKCSDGQRTFSQQYTLITAACIAQQRY